MSWHAIPSALGTLPEQRAALYGALVENILKIWLRRKECREQNLKREQILAAIEPVAAELQARSGERMIGSEELGKLIGEPLATARGMPIESRRFREAKGALLTVMKDQVGLLAEQSPDNYTFFQRTFQEYLAAWHMLANPLTAAQTIRARLSDPLWRVPVVLV